LSYIGSMKQRYLDNLKNKSAKGRWEKWTMQLILVWSLPTP
jgi:hypothetical protein